MKRYLIPTIFLLPSAVCLAQGPLTPPGAPAPTQKSLQEIWDRVGTLEAKVTSQQNLIQQQNAQIDGMATQLGVTLPWTISVVDAVAGAGDYCSLSYTPGGQPAISYYNSTTGDLDYAVSDGSQWHITTVDAPGDVGTSTSLKFTQDGQPAISYYDVTNHAIKYAVLNGGSWTLSTVDSSINNFQYSAYTSLAFTPDGQPGISYFDLSTTRVKYAYPNQLNTGPAWIVSIVDTNLHNGGYSSLAVSPIGQPSISYTDDTNGDLKYAVLNGTVWARTTVESEGSVGYYTDLAFTPRGQPAISYFDFGNNTLK